MAAEPPNSTASQNAARVRTPAAERIEELKKLAQQAEVQWADGRIDLRTVIAAHIALIDVQLETAGSGTMRIAMLQQHVASAQGLLDQVQRRFTAGYETQDNVERARVAYLNARIRLAEQQRDCIAVRQFQKERLETLKRITEIVTVRQQFRGGNLQEVCDAQIEQIDGELALTGDSEARAALLKRQTQAAETWFNSVKARFQAGLASEQELALAQAAWLDYRIRLADQQKDAATAKALRAEREKRLHDKPSP